MLFKLIMRRIRLPTRNKRTGFTGTPHAVLATFHSKLVMIKQVHLLPVLPILFHY